MAWIGIFLGAISGLIGMVLGLALFDMPLWQGLLLYPAVGVTVSLPTVAVLLILQLRHPVLPALENSAEHASA